jgi:hypothetical protein
MEQFCGLVFLFGAVYAGMALLFAVNSGLPF